MSQTAAASEPFRMIEKLRAPPCTMCNVAKPKVCDACQSSAYCSAACQGADWPTHKLLCHTYKGFLECRPSPAQKQFHRAGILFPVDQETPKLVWVKITNKARAVQEPIHVLAIHADCKLDLTTLFGGKQKAKDIRIEDNLRHRFPLKCTLVVSRPQDYKDQPVNKCIQKIVGGDEYWKSPIVVTRQFDFGKEKDDKPPPLPGQFVLRTAKGIDVEDMTLADLRHAVDLFTMVPNTQLAEELSG
ncbi:hypothetical protein BJ170DRAFT_635333 [Xylariales sp. AK1849]|nr:hypothetical protein BJ170DRAFT_635333 [Xylariales sp. AK1849]